MYHRPWPIIILGWIFLLMPIGNIAVMALVSEVSPWLYISHMRDPVEFFTLFLVSPLAGLAILAVKNWSLPVFVLLMTFSFVNNFMQWRQFPDQISLWLLLGIYFYKVILVGYFLIPTVRRVYTEKKLRWWEQATRYYIEIPANLSGVFGSETVKITDISETGAFISTNTVFDLKAQVHLMFDFEDESFDLPGQPVYRREDGVKGYGVQFVELEGKTKAQLKAFCRDKLGQRAEVRRSVPRRDYLEDFVSWAGGVFKGGKGLVPELPAKK